MARRSTPALSVAAQRYVDYCYGRGGSDGVRYSQRSLLGRLSRFLNDCQTGSVTPEQIEEFFYGAGGLATNCARSTLGKYFGDLRAFFDWTHRRGWSDAPGFLLGGITHTSTRVQRNRVRLSEPQMWAMVEHAPTPRDAAMVVFAMHTGCRISEILDLRIRDLNLDTREVAMRIIKSRAEDVMRVSPVLDRYLREWLSVYHDMHAPARDARLFPAGNRPTFVNGMCADWQERGFDPYRKINNPVTIIRPMAEAAGVSLESGDGWHTIRRSVARIFFDKASHLGHDAALRMTSAFLHHKNTSTTEIYLGLELEKAKRDEIMSEGFLSNPADNASIANMSDYRKA